WTTVPSFLAALIGFVIVGFNVEPAGGDSGLDATLAALTANFEINLLVLLPVVVVVTMAAKKLPAIASIMAGVLAGIIIALVFQRPAIAALAEDTTLSPALATAKALWTVLFNGYSAATGNENLDSLLSRGGMSSMLTTVWLILTALCFGAAMEKAGILERLVHGLVNTAKSVGALIATTLGTSFGVNVLAADQYMAIVLPGRMFKDAYAERGLHPKNLSRTLEDAGTITSPLIPWNTCGAYMAATLGVPTLAYLPFCFFNLVNPLVAAAYGYTGFTIEPADEETPDAAAPVVRA
ncbi:MAG: Na+/H+ antiporter NhaC family protein, partial [Pseudomonadota bacterium]